MQVNHVSWFLGIREFELHNALPDAQDTQQIILAALEAAKVNHVAVTVACRVTTSFCHRKSSCDQELDQILDSGLLSIVDHTAYNANM